MQTDYVSTLFDGHSNADKVTVALTMAVNALAKGHSATIILMAQAVELGRPGAADDINIGAPFKPAKELLATYLEQGGRISVCSSCMIHGGFTADDMDPKYSIINAPDVIDLVMGAKGTLQIA